MARARTCCGRFPLLDKKAREAVEGRKLPESWLRASGLLDLIDRSQYRVSVTLTTR